MIVQPVKVNYYQYRSVIEQRGEDMVNDKTLGPLLTVKEVARLLHIHSNTVRRWSNTGVLPVYRIGARGDRRFKMKDVLNLLAPK